MLKCNATPLLEAGEKAKIPVKCSFLVKEMKKLEWAENLNVGLYSRRLEKVMFLNESHFLFMGNTADLSGSGRVSS